MNEKFERKLIKQDAKIVIAQNWKTFLFASLPVIFLNLILEFMQAFSFIDSKVFYGIIVLVVLFYIPAFICQNEIILRKLRQEDVKVSSAFHWFTAASYWWASIKLAFVYIAIAVILVLAISTAATGVTLSSNIFTNPTIAFYYEMVVSVITVFVVMLISFLTMPAINMLISHPTAKTRDILRIALRLSKKNFKGLLFFMLTFVFLIISVFILNRAAIINLSSFLEANSILLNSLYTLVGFVLYLAAFYLIFYMNTSMLSYVELLIARENPENLEI